MPNAIGDDATKYQCLSCFADIVFETCLDCGFKQSVPARWNTAYSCGKCGVRCELPRRRLYASSTKARGVEGYGYAFPRI